MTKRRRRRRRKRKKKKKKKKRRRRRRWLGHSYALMSLFVYKATMSQCVNKAGRECVFPSVIVFACACVYA